MIRANHIERIPPHIILIGAIGSDGQKVIRTTIATSHIRKSVVVEAIAHIEEHSNNMPNWILA